MALYNVNQPPLEIPQSWFVDRLVRLFGDRLTMFLFQAWQAIIYDSSLSQTGSGDIDVVTDVEIVSATATRTLPEMEYAKKRVTIKNTSSVNITVATPDSALIEGSTTAIIVSGDSYTLFPDGTNWYIV